MAVRFEELAWRATPMGEISLRRRVEPTLGVDVYEVKLGDEYLMSSLFTVAEVALATLGLAAVEGDALAVVVGGLGLGYTARAVLTDPRVASLQVIEALSDVIAWHRDAVLPMAVPMNADPRCELVEGDFFAMVAGEDFGPSVPSQVDAVLLDIDHTPRHVLHPSHAAFYTLDGLGRLASMLRSGGVFALWSDEPPDEEFLAVMRRVFTEVTAQVVDFDNPLTRGVSSNTVYVARTPEASRPISPSLSVKVG
jgi:spermidine synthase